MHPSWWLRLWFGIREPVTRSQYVASGIGLAAFKYAVEAAVILAFTGNGLTPLDFLNPSLAARQTALAGAPDWLAWALFAWNLPFVWIALSMSVRRAAVAGLPPWAGMAALLPVAGIVMMISLAVADDRAPENWWPPAGHDASPEAGTSLAGLRAIAAALAVGLGGLLGKAVADMAGPRSAPLVPLVLALPLVAGAERLVNPGPPEYCVLTVVEVAATPAAVWPHVVEFPDLPEPDDWFFRCGIACPLRARIEGRGVGAVRHCEFSTGDFVEPITVWDEPRRLAFDVASQPDPMTELSPWRHVHPPHLHEQSLKSRRGEFRLVDIGGGRTRLEGRTWYTFDMHPQAYWTLWSDLSIHRIHRRVLDHVKRLAEAEPSPAIPAGGER
jgi:hypothetical protein